MELGSILQFLENKTILVTGATGYLAKSTHLLTTFLFMEILC
jgi:FlaA1/EpsC-like NDP-sugar epimerase